MEARENKMQTHHTKPQAKHVPNASEKPEDDEPNVNKSFLQGV